jgi:DNA-binding LytR/AlgR family response regulator
MMRNNEVKLKCLVVEDDASSQYLIIKFIESSDSLELISCVGNASEAKNVLSSQEVDLLFLDINLPGISGIELLESLQTHPPVIFTTAYPNFAIDSFNFNVIDYLLKPITQERFNKSVRRAIDKNFVDISKQPQVSTGSDNTIDIPLGCDSIKVNINTIRYFQSWGNYVKVFTTKEMILASISTKGLIEMLPSSLFIRVHKSYTINKNFVTSRNKDEIIMASTVIPVGISYRQSVKSIFQNF